MKKVVKAKVPAKKKVVKGRKAPVGGGPLTSARGVRAASRGGHIPAERYSRDPASVTARVREKIERLLSLTSNCVVRAERNGAPEKQVAKLRAAIGHLESVGSALA